ncbi:MAG: 4-hydroxy-tetrahydrodipicolinate synthase [Gemmatimonadetes bacterium]|nr:4-hydroxy-tetrahydrodipicolinate synthase [Gemmatimonadota bacterium]
MTPPLRGCGTALVTPFTADGALDEAALRRFVEWQVTEGIHFVVPCGSTGEAVTMTPDEQRRVVEITVDQVKGRVPVVAGAGSNDTKKAIAASRMMREAGATHLLHVSPMYNKPPQRGIIAHFKAIAAEAGLPIVVYNVPGRTGSNIEAKTTLTLAELPGIVAIKEASGNLAQVHEILLHRPAHFTVLSGDDSLALAMMAAGAEGVISVTSNATPRAMAQLCDRLAAHDLAGARALHLALLPWMEAAFCEPNPIPAKAACAMLGHMQNALRLPLVPLSADKESVVRGALAAAGTRT